MPVGLNHGGIEGQGNESQFGVDDANANCPSPRLSNSKGQNSSKYAILSGNFIFLSGGVSRESGGPSPSHIPPLIRSQAFWIHHHITSH